MIRTTLILLALAPGLAAAGERISGVNSYVQNLESWHAGDLTYWRQDNNGVYEVKEGPLDPGFVRCIGAGFSGPTGVKGEGICIFGEDNDTFTWSWRTHPGGPNTWKVIDATGKYKGMTGSGVSRSRVASEFQALQHRVTDWEGEIELPD